MDERVGHRNHFRDPIAIDAVRLEPFVGLSDDLFRTFISGPLLNHEVNRQAKFFHHSSRSSLSNHDDHLTGLLQFTNDPDGRFCQSDIARAVAFFPPRKRENDDTLQLSPTFLAIKGQNQ